ncbi:MAG TPA: hypothetical protein VNZ55_14460 [Thermomicrobiales bacterium]|nr:hypothetical protein [Thermomicrobiales bacterium]
MGQPGITDEQRLMAVALLANAIRKDSHLRNRPPRSQEQAASLTSLMAGKRSESSQRYIDGMRDLLRVLFADGADLTDEILEEAYAQAMGMPAPLSPTDMEFQ